MGYGGGIMRIIMLSQNFENYDEGDYHQDLTNAACNVADTFVYGPGYKNYSPNDDIHIIIEKSGWSISEIDFIIAGTSWDKYVQWKNGDPHKRIQLKQIKGPTKIYFLQNEYKLMDAKLGYAEKQGYDYVVSAYKRGIYDEWSRRTGIKVIYSKLAIDLNKFNDFQLKRKFDFYFSGVLHEEFLPERRLVKNEIFERTKLVGDKEICSNKGIFRLLSISNPIRKKYRKYNIYWAERGRFTRDLLGRTLTPHGSRYVKLLNQSKVALCTYSANRQFGPRFYELMRTGTLIFCPEDDYEGILVDNINCIMFKRDMSDFEEKLQMCIEDEHLRARITAMGKKYVLGQDYEHRLIEIFEYIENERS